MSEPTLDAILELVGALAGEAVEPETPLLSSGRLDSYQLLDLVEGLEERYGFAAEAADVSTDVFDTPARILAYVRRKQAES